MDLRLLIRLPAAVENHTTFSYYAHDNDGYVKKRDQWFLEMVVYSVA